MEPYLCKYEIKSNMETYSNSIHNAARTRHQLIVASKENCIPGSDSLLDRTRVHVRDASPPRGRKVGGVEQAIGKGETLAVACGSDRSRL